MTYIVAEIGNTHEGSVGLAKRFIEVAAKCGVDAVKMQTHIFHAESRADAPSPHYFKDESRKVYFERTAFSLEQYVELKRYAEVDCKVDFFSSAFSTEAVALLEKISVSWHKIPSGEVTNLPLLEKVASTGKKVILSTGMSSWQEIDAAVACLRKNGCTQLTILQCTSEYPCPPEESGLNVIGELKARYPFAEIGYSDHTLGSAIPTAAVVLGATFVEKHFTLSKNMYGSDAKFATEPTEFSQLVRDIRAVELALTKQVDKDKKASTLVEMKRVFEKSIVASRPLTKGALIDFTDLAFKKPGDGLSPLRYRELIGKKLKIDVQGDHVFRFEDFI